LTECRGVGGETLRRRTMGITDLSQKRSNNAPESDPGSPHKKRGISIARPLRLLVTLRTWAYGHWLRSVSVAAILLGVIALTMTGWAYLASMALHSGMLSLDVALEALDEQRYDEARAFVGRMLKSGLLPRSDYGGPLFVLGAVKIHDAENQASASRRRVEYLVASRYLKEARAHGFPAARAAEGMLLLGKSLVESGQFGEGLRTLDELLAEDSVGNNNMIFEAQRLAAITCLLMPNPKVELALQHNNALLQNDLLPVDETTSALLQRIECLLRLKRFDEARQSLESLGDETRHSASISLMHGRLVLDEFQAASEKATTEERSERSESARQSLSKAVMRFHEAAKLDAEKDYVTRQASYHAGRALELQGDSQAALAQYSRTRQLYGDSLEGLAASLAEADLMRNQGDWDGAFAAYRRVLDSFKNIPVYRSVVFPVGQIRDRTVAALRDAVAHRRFDNVLELIDNFQPLFSRAEQLELRGSTLEQWGRLLLSGNSASEDGTGKQHALGRQKLRAAGVAFEHLAELQFATRHYSGDVWRAAEDYFDGHSFSSTIRLLTKYLAFEPEIRNAQALLRLGQAHLALGQVPDAIASFEECIEFHPLDGATFQARIDCAKAYWHKGETSRAEQLLRQNIAGSALKPSSREWKDSLFELGMLLHETGQFEQAIGTLEEAIERYPQDAQRLMSQYVLADSYRRWAEELIDSAAQARTTNEREKARSLASTRLTAALQHFEEVQVTITLRTHDLHSDPLLESMLRNCYMLEGTVLFDLGRYKEAIEVYSNVASLYPDHPFVLETFVQIANCWRRLGQAVKARGAIQQAQIVLQGLPPDADFASTTTLNREEWNMLLANMSRW
jgi:tetratricopeptide (TPR) repeat protein